MPDTTTGSYALFIPGIDDLEPIARGGFGTVYSGWQASMRRKVAVKVLDPASTDAEAEERFQREVMAMGSVSDHPNVVPVYATGTVDDRHYLVMPLLSDGSLADLLEHGALPPQEVVDLGVGLAGALAAAHHAGVLHRDVKPGNVLRTPYGAFQLADFGVARLADATQTMGGNLLATVAYAAPEVLAGEPATEASDVYSLGATLHAALRGRPPYEAGPDDAPISLAVRVINSDPPDLRAAGVPGDLASVVERAMAREVHDRWSTATDLRDALERLRLGAHSSPAAPATDVPLDATVPLAITPAVAVPPTEVHPVSGSPAVASEPVLAPIEPARRRRAWAGMLAVLALVAVGVAAWLARDDDTTADPSASEAPTTTGASSTTAPSSTTTTEPSTTTAPAPPTTSPAPAAPTSVADAIRSYYALMDGGRIDEGWALLSPGYQDRTGEASYRRFWQSIADVEVLEAGGGDLDGTATLRYTRDDGSTSTEAVALRFVRDPDGGGLLIDDYRVV